MLNNVKLIIDKVEYNLKEVELFEESTVKGKKLLVKGFVVSTKEQSTFKGVKQPKKKTSKDNSSGTTKQ